jgi:hypothetical protein
LSKIQKISLPLTILLVLFILTISKESIHRINRKPIVWYPSKAQYNLGTGIELEVTKHELQELITPTPIPTIKPKPTETPIVIPDKEYIKKRVCEVFGPQCPNALIIAEKESGFRTNIKSPTNDFGVMQINCPSHKKKVAGDCTKLYDLETNLRIAKGIYDASGWNAWSTKIYLR